MRKIWVLAALVAGLLVGVTAPAQAANILANAGFESGSLSPWACDGGPVVDSPARTGSHALAGGVANTGHTFPGLRPDQIGIGVPAAVSAGNGYTPPAQVQQAVTCLVKGTGCGGYTLRGGTSPDLRGLMTWSINWDRYYGWDFMDSHEPFLNGLP